MTYFLFLTFAPAKIFELHTFIRNTMNYAKRDVTREIIPSIITDCAIA